MDIKKVFILETIKLKVCEECFSPLWIVTPDRDVLCLDLFAKGCKARRPIPKCVEIEQ